jgi:hypothetical protein
VQQPCDSREQGEAQPLSRRQYHQAGHRQIFSTNPFAAERGKDREVLMPNDSFGRPVSVGDTVVIKGEVTKVLDNPNYINCTVKLAKPMPPSGAEMNIELNTAQVENTSSGKPEAGSSKGHPAEQQSHPSHMEQQQPNQPLKPPSQQQQKK